MLVTLHDFTEAWTVIYSLLRSRFPCDPEESLALEPLKASMDRVLCAPDHDVRRAFVNPITKTISELARSPVHVIFSCSPASLPVITAAAVHSLGCYAIRVYYIVWCNLNILL
jgi:hypothetical protein